MSAALIMRPSPIPEPRVHGEWISLAAAARIMGRTSNPSAVKSIALAGGIRTHYQPGLRLLYFKADVERLAARDCAQAPSEGVGGESAAKAHPPLTAAPTARVS